MNNTETHTVVPYSESSFTEKILQLKEKTFALLTRKFPNATPQDIEDAAQVANIRSHKYYEQFAGGSTFDTWYTKIAINALLDILKKKSNQHVLYGMINDILHQRDSNPMTQEAALDLYAEEHQKGADEEICEKERLEEIRNAIQESVSELKDKQSKIFELIFVKELSYKDAAAELEIPIGTVMSQVHNIRKILQGSISRRLNFAEV